MNLKKRFHQDLNQYDTPASPIAEARAARPALRPRKKWLSAPVAIAMALLLTVGAAAAGVGVVKYLNRDIITENTLRLSEVPEGYVGIYSVEDLVQMRKDIEAGTGAAKYILMSDITFTDADYAEGGICEGGWDPIDLRLHRYVKGDIADESFVNENRIDGYTGAAQHGGTEYIRYTAQRKLELFNGNGYVIRNLKLTADAATALRENEYGYANDLYLGLFGDALDQQLKIINLGIEGCQITITADALDAYDGDIMIGAIAADTAYIGACYVKDLSVTVDLTTASYVNSENVIMENNSFRMFLGAIAGRANYLDACYAENYKMNLSANGDADISLLGGGISAMASACLTSWSDGSWQVLGNAWSDTDYADILPASTNILFPNIMTEEHFDLLRSKLAEKYGERSFEQNMVRAYFVRKSLSDLEESPQKDQLKLMMDQWNEIYTLASGNETVYHDTLYIYDPSAEIGESLKIQDLALEAFGSYEEYRAFCSANTVIAGEIWCHTLVGESDLTEADFEGYDFSTLWYLADGKPRLRIFE